MNGYKVMTDVFSSLLICTITVLTYPLHSTAAVLTLLISLLYLSLSFITASFKKNQIYFHFTQVALVILAILHLKLFWLLFGNVLFHFEFKNLKKNFGMIWCTLPVFLIFLDKQISLREQLFAFFWCLLVYFFEALQNNYYAAIYNQESNLLKRRLQIAHLSKRLLTVSNEAKQQTELAELKERNRLTHEIHDQLGHSLTGGLIQLEAAQILLKQDPEKAKRLLEQATEISRTGIEEIRQILKATAPSHSRLSWQQLQLELADFESNYAIKTVKKFHGDLGMITPLQWQILLQNLQETLTNTIKYAHANQVEVELNVFNEIIQFKFSNDGDVPVNVKKGLGILGMEQRLAQIEGQLIVDTTNNFELNMLLPISKS